MAKSPKVLVKMQSTESHHWVVRSRNPRQNPEKLSFMRYDPVVRKHVRYEEKKLSSGKKKT